MTEPEIPEDPLEALAHAREALAQAVGALASTAPEQDQDARLGEYPPVLSGVLSSLSELTTRLAVQTDATSGSTTPGQLGEVETDEQSPTSTHLHALLNALNEAATHAAQAAATTDDLG